MQPDFHAELDPRWRDCIVIYCAHNYVVISDLWAAKALRHEFAHAYQLRHWPEKQPQIYSAWKNAMNEHLYMNVKDDDGKTVPAAYATANQLEYFAELSCMYFGECNYYPFNRKQLNRYDHTGYKMIEFMWYAQNPPVAQY